jgi:hypothetical protein
MATIGDLVRAVSEAEGLEENFVSVYARAAREAKLIAHYGRGRSAARMSPSDGANLLIGLNGSALAKEAPATIGAFRRLRLRWIWPAEQSSFTPEMIGRNIAFGQALERLLTAFIPDKNGGQEIDHLVVENLSYAKGGLTRDELIRAAARHIRIEVAFERPRRVGLISFIMADTRRGVEEGRAVLRARYEAPEDAKKPDEAFGDRIQRTTITRRTLSAVGQILDN